MKVSAIEKQLGIETFATSNKGIGGAIRQRPGDFAVEEILVDGSKAELEPKQPSQISGEGRYLICLLIKRNWDTLLATRRIAGQLGISEQRIRIAGIKDKKAITAQHISIENIKLKHLRRITLRDAKVFPLRYSPNMIFPHMSFGNAFQLTIRNISHSANTIQETATAFVDELHNLDGIPNFFGHQRFGTIRPITHLVGKALVQSNLEKAAMLFLAKSSSYEHPQSRRVRQKLLETQDFKEAFVRFPKNLLYERLMTAHLARHPKEYIGSFRRLPKRLCRLLIQAYQSYLFNRFLSQRMIHKIPIDQPQIGDYVTRIDSHGLPAGSYMKVNFENLDDLQKVVKKGKMQVAIPLIGFKQDLSDGKQGDIEQSILESEKIARQAFYISSMPEMSAAGELRSAKTPILNLNVEKPLRDELNPGKKKLVISFTLQRGSYATIVLRELMKPRSLIKAGF